MVNRVTYRGVGLFINGQQIDRATAFGASGTINKEDMFEIGNSGIVEVVDDISEVSMTLDANEYGSLKTLAAVCGKEDAPGTTIDFVKDIGKAGAVTIWNYIKPLGYDDILYTQFMKNCFLNSYSANFVTDGNATESYGFVSDNKKWFLGANSHVVKVPLQYETATWTGTVPEATTTKIQALVVDGHEVTDYEDATSAGGAIEVTIPDTSGTEDVYAIVSADAGGEIFVPDKDSPGGKRRGHVELYLVTGHTYDGGVITGGDEEKQFRVQSVSVDASLDREDLGQLGFTHYYDRPLVLPMSVTTSFDLTFADLNMFKQFVTESPGGELSIDNFRDDIGMIVRIYDKRDIDIGRKVVKEVHIPYLIASDEAFNISLDGNATQTFSFRSHELAALRPSVI